MVESTSSELKGSQKSLSTEDLVDLAEFYVEFLRKLKLSNFSKNKNEYIYFFEQVHSRIPPQKKIANPEILIPITIFVFLRMKLAPITPSTFVESNIMSKMELAKHLREYLHYIPEYQSRNRRGLVMAMITHVGDILEYPKAFLEKCERLLDVFWRELSHTTERVTAATVFCLTLIYVEDAPPPFIGICNQFGVQMSTIIYQIKHKLIERHRIKGFTTLRQSISLVKQFLLKSI